MDNARLELAYGSGSEKHQSADEQDAALIGMLANGDVRALEVLYARYSRPIFSLAIRIVGVEADAEEVMQDVLERVWRRAPTFDPARGRFGSWVLGMTHHVAIDLLRRRQRRPQSIDTEAGEQVVALTPDGSQDVAETVIQNEEARRIRQALQELPEPQQQAIELAFFKGLSHLEIAAATGDPLGTVKTRIRRGMERLKSVLGSE
jgi:RNA polymerase sigma-70 factor (ECF subfamily)